MKRVRGEDDDGDRALSRPQKRERIDVFGRLHDEVWSVPGGNPKLGERNRMLFLPPPSHQSLESHRSCD